MFKFWGLPVALGHPPSAIEPYKWLLLLLLLVIPCAAGAGAGRRGANLRLKFRLYTVQLRGIIIQAALLEQLATESVPHTYHQRSYESASNSHNNIH